MKERLKYYLRGLGTGIVVTMVLMLVSNANAAQSTIDDKNVAVEQEEQKSNLIVRETENRQEQSTSEIEADVDSETKERLPEEAVSQGLAVVESAAADMTEKEPAVESAEDIVVETSEVENSVEVETITVTQESQIQSEDAGKQTVDAAVTIQVVKGDGSGTVARKLQNAGLIDNASEFDAYLMQHGYDKKIRIGTVKIEAGATWMEIAEKLAGK